MQPDVPIKGQPSPAYQAEAREEGCCQPGCQNGVRTSSATVEINYNLPMKDEFLKVNRL